MKRFHAATPFILINAVCCSGDSRDEQKQDDLFAYSLTDEYDDDIGYNATSSNLTYYERWQADDPYFPDDDDMRRQFYEDVEMQDVGVNGTNVEIEKETNFFLASIDPVAIASVACFSLTGIIACSCCVALVMYYLKHYSLMRQYATSGVVVEAKLLASDPNMINYIEKEEEEDKRGLIHIDGSNGSDEQSYHEMADGDETTVTSYRRIDTRSDETEHSDETKEQILTPRHSNKHSNKGKNNGENKNSSSSFTPIQGLMKNQQQKELLRSKHQLVTAEKFQMRRNQAPKEFVTCNQKFRSVIEYDDPPASDGSKIRKHLNVMGEDVVIIEDATNQLKEFRIKLFVLSNHQMSGLPCGEVQRARRCHRCMFFIPCLALGLAVIAGCGYATYLHSPLAFSTAYAIALVIQVPLMGYFLRTSFDKVLTSSYLQKGTKVSLEEAERGYNEKLDSISFAAA